MIDDRGRAHTGNPGNPADRCVVKPVTADERLGRVQNMVCCCLRWVHRNTPSSHGSGGQSKAFARTCVSCCNDTFVTISERRSKNKFGKNTHILYLGAELHSII